MEVLFHFTLVVFKIAVQASIYALIILLLFRQINKSNPTSWFQKVTRKKKRFWFVSGAIISIGLFVWAFTYWGNHGLGDSARIPIGHGKEIEQINGVWTFISPDGHEFEKFSIQSFAVKGGYCSGKVEQNSEMYYIWDLETNSIQTLDSKTEYQTQADMLNLPAESAFADFWEGYRKHWGGWRFWLLP